MSENTFDPEILEAETERRVSKLTPNTYISLGLMACMISGAVWLNNRLNALDNKFDGLVRLTAAQWTQQDQEIFALKLQLSNPNMKIPEVRDIVGLKRENEGRSRSGAE